ncbi:hypothetical protein B0H19DRAFT_1063069 [Mycena capillaripes]|nr:hypothetical protein B0H19DRAFT_1063069 [Mycena capillaripes]
MSEGKKSKKGKGKGKEIPTESEFQEEKALKKLAKQKKQAEALTPNVADAQGMVSNQFFIGWGICPIVVPRLGGNGPTVVPGPLQRPKQPKAMEQLRQIAGEDGSGLLRLDPSHSLTFGVNPKLLDLTTLSKDLNGPFLQVKWQEAAFDTEITMYAGLHRTEFLKEELLKDTYGEYKRVNKLLIKNPNNLKHLQKVRELEKTLNEKGLWLCGFYDALTRLKERFVEDTRKSQTVLLQLSSNNALTSHPDTPLHHFSNIARTLAASKHPEDRNGLLGWAKGTMPGDVSTLLYKHKDVVELLASLHNIPAFAVDGLTPSQLLEAKKTIWGMLEPFIRGGYYALVYLTAPVDAILGNGNSIDNVPVEIYSQAIVDCFTKNTDGTPKAGEITAQSIDKLASPVIRDNLVKIFDGAFETHLAKRMDYFALRNSKIWSDAMEEYETAVGAAVATFVKEEVESETWEEPDIAILKLVPSKLDHILKHQRMTSYPFLPDMPCKLPMLSPGFLHSLYGVLKELTPALSLRAGTRSKSTGEVATPSETCLILHHLSYFQDLGDSNKDWSHADFPKSGMVYWSPETKASCATDPVARLWLALVAFTLEHRTVMLKHCTIIERALSAETEKFGATYEASLQLALKKWCDEAYNMERVRTPNFKKPDVLPRHMQQCPSKIYEDDDRHIFNKHPNFRRGLEWSTYNFLTSPAGNNNIPMRLRYSQALWGDYKVLKDSVYPMIEEGADVLLVFKAKLHSLITMTQGLQQWQFWLETDPEHTAPLATAALPSAEDKDVSVVRTYLQNEEFHAILTGSFTKLAKTLNKRGVCGVPTLVIADHDHEEDDEEGEQDGEQEVKPTGVLALHPALALALENLYKFQTAEQIHEDLAALEHKDKTRKMKKVSWYKFSNKFTERGIPVYYASAYEVEKYYGEETTVMTKKHVKNATVGSSKADGVQSKEKRPAEDEPAQHISKRARMERDPGADAENQNTEALVTPYPSNQLALNEDHLTLILVFNLGYWKDSHPLADFFIQRS